MGIVGLYSVYIFVGYALHYDSIIQVVRCHVHLYVLFSSRCRPRMKTWCGREQSRTLFVQKCISRHSKLVELFSVEYYLTWYTCVPEPPGQYRCTTANITVIGDNLASSLTVLAHPVAAVEVWPAHPLVLPSRLFFTFSDALAIS